MAETTDALLAEVKRQFLRRTGTVRMKKDTYEAANIYAQDLGELLADVFRDVLKEDALPDGRLYRETADAVVRPMMEEAYKKAADAAKTAQNALNESAGIGLKAVEPMSAAEKAEQITYVVDNACRPGDYAAEMNLLGRETVQFSRKVVDSSIRKNAEFQYNAGIETTVTRVYDGRGLHDGKSPCTWCLARAGTDVPYKEAYAKGMFERHPGCGCVITYNCEKGRYSQGGGQWEHNTWSNADRQDWAEAGYADAGFSLTDFKNMKVGQSGGKHYKPYDPENPRDLKAASTYRELSRVNDLSKIANSSGMTLSEVKQIKRHIFFEKHKLYDGYGTFSPDYDMAVAWKRLSDGRPLSRDILLLKHELLESQLEREYNLTAAEAHRQASKTYDWSRQLKIETNSLGEKDGLL